VELNSAENLRDLLQHVIDLSDEQIIQAQDEINKLKNSTDLKNEPIDGKAKYAKAINDYMTLKKKAIDGKFEVARLLNEVIIHKGAIDTDTNMASGSIGLDLNSIQELIDKSVVKKEGTSETKTITLKKK
jgi:hypothetical protein